MKKIICIDEKTMRPNERKEELCLHSGESPWSIVKREYYQTEDICGWRRKRNVREAPVWKKR